MIHEHNFDASNPNFPFNLSEREKAADNFALSKYMMDFYDLTYALDAEKVARYDENYLLHSGRWPQLERISNDISFALEGENILMNGGALRHYPIIDAVSKSIVADILINPNVAIIKDFSAKANNIRKETLLKMVKDFIREKYITPKINEMYSQYMQQNGTDSIMNLTPEEQDQVVADIERRAMEQVPESIIRAMEEFRTPDERILYAFYNDAYREQNVGSKMAVAAENAVVTSAPYFRLGVMDDLPFMEVLNPKWVTWAGSEHTEWAQDGLFAKYEQYLTPQDVIAKYGSYLKKKDIQQIRDMFFPIPGSHSSQRDTSGIDFEVVEAVADNPELQAINLRSSAGQSDYINLLRNLRASHREGYGIRECYITHRWTARMYKLIRSVNGKDKVYYLSDHYVKNPALGDISVSNILVPQVWHGVKLGTKSDDYVFIEPVKGQYNNFKNPFKVDLTIYGGELNTFSNNVPNASHIDLGKPWQYKFNLLMKQWEEADATDIGKILVGSVDSKPDGWSYSEWFASMKYGKFLLTKGASDGKSQLGQTDLIRSEDVSQSSRIADIVNRLGYIEQKVFSSMYYNPNKMGMISQYANIQNTQSNISASDRQMYRFHSKFRELKTKVLEAFLRYTFIAYEANDNKKEVLLDNFCREYLDLNKGEFNPLDISFSVVDDFKESEKLEQVRQLALSFIQNGMSGSEITAIINAESMGEVEDIWKRFEDRRAKEAQQQQAYTIDLEKEKRATMENLEKMRQEFDLLKQERDNEVKIKLAEINSMFMANANDINKDNVNDSLNKAVLEMENQYKMHLDKLEFMYYELDKKLANESSNSEKDRKTQKEIANKRSK